MHIIKQLPEDFIVQERSNLIFQDNGRYAYFLLKKKNKNTLQAIQEIARALHIPEKNIGFAGSKDRQAVTEQVISIIGVQKENILKINLPNITVMFLGYRNVPLSLGELEGNHFTIIVRNIAQSVNLKPISRIVNYFDEQRFSQRNIAIGKYLLTKRFSEAVSLIDSPSVDCHLQQHNHDVVGALKKIPARLLKLYLHAYQSWIWNKTVEALLSSEKGAQRIAYSAGEFIFINPPPDLPNADIPLIGADFVPEPTVVGTIIQEILAEEKITPSDFILRPLPGLTVMCGSRKLFAQVTEFKLEYGADELHPEMGKTKLQFFLPKGSYATIVIKSLFL